MKKHISIAVRYTLVTAVILGLGYPLLITVIARLSMPNKANGQILSQGGEAIGSTLIGQPFTGSGYFHGRPSAAGTGYDASASSGSNYASTNKALIDRVQSSVKAEDAGADVPVDLVTASASGLDPDITPAAALYQVARVADERKLAHGDVEALVQRMTTPRQLGLLGEARVNVLQLNLALDRLASKNHS